MMMSATGSENGKGFTLVETLLAVTILAVGIVGVLRAYAAAVNALEASMYTQEALCLAKEKMAEVEETAIEENGTVPAKERGSFEGRYKCFKWESDIDTTDLFLIDYEHPEEEPSRVFLNKLKVTLTNEDVKPARRFSLETYIENRLEE